MTGAVTRAAALPGLDPATYQRHPLHTEGRVWVEKNCYVDIWIELLHAASLDPAAVLPFTLAIDFEGDQWTFFKPPHGELYDLYGVDVQELTVWRPLVEHAVHHLREGKLISTEADAFWLPDTSGTDYRQTHTKTTVVLQDIDLEARRLGYFHNAGYHALEGEDFVKTFRLDAPPDPTFMPLFAELVRIDRVVRRPREELAAMSRELLRKHHARRPAENPIRRFRRRLDEDFPEIQRRGLDHYHAWAFATVRQLGAAFELAAFHLRWLDGVTMGETPKPPPEASGEAGYASAAEHFDQVSAAAQGFILKGARAVRNKKPLDAALFDEMASHWDRGMDALAARLQPGRAG